jgi:hypothetical protein
MHHERWFGKSWADWTITWRQLAVTFSSSTSTCNRWLLLTKPLREYAAQIELDIEDEKYALTAQQLMVKMNTKYRALRVKKLWNAPTAEDEKIMALQAQIDSFSVKKREKNRGPKAVKRGSNKDSKNKRYSTDPEWLTKNIKPTPASKIMKHKGVPWH